MPKLGYNVADGASIVARDVWYQDGATLRRLSAIWRNEGGTLVKVYAAPVATQPLAVVASPSSDGDVYDNSYGAGGAAFNFNATASGGAGGYSYSWSRIAQAGNMGATAAGASTSHLNLSCTWPAKVGRSCSETWRVTVTDSAGATATFDINLYVRAGSGFA